MRLLLYVDTEARKIVGGSNDPSPISLPELMQGDIVDLTLQGVVRQNVFGEDVYRLTPIPFAGIKCAITRGADVAPKGGTIRLRLVGGATDDVTPAFAPDITKPALQALLNALPGVVAKGGLVVQTSNTATNIFRLRWNNAEETAAFEFTENRLEPRSDTRSVVAALPNGQIQALKVRQLPLAFTDQFYLPAAPVLKVASVRTGTSTRNCIQAIGTPRASIGQVHFVFQSLSTRILSVTGLTPTAVAAALNDLYSDGQTRFAVTQPSSAVLYVEFVGPLALADQPPLGVEMHDQAPLETPTARLSLDGPSLELAFDGGKTLSLTLAQVLRLTSILLAVADFVFPHATIALDKLVDRYRRTTAAYQAVQAMKPNGVPAPVAFCLFYREADNDFADSPAQGDPLTHRSRNVPARRIPGKTPPFKWSDAAFDAYYVCDRLDLWDWRTVGSTLGAIESFNGTGYARYHPAVPSPYLRSGTTLYSRGKYVSDGRFDPSAVDKQMGVAAILKRFGERGVVLPFGR